MPSTANTDPSLEGVDTPELGDFGLGELSNTKLEDNLASYVQRQYMFAKQNRQNVGITDRLLRNLYAKRCKYLPDEEALLGPHNNIYIGLCALKARAAASWLVDIVMNNIDKPWTIDPTPEPELPESLMEQAINVLLQELPSFNTADALKDRAMQVKSALQAINMKQAQDATKRMETRINDQLTEGDWIDTYANFIDNLTVFPTAFIRGPIECNLPQAEWDGNKFEVKQKTVPKVRIVSPFDAYPSPNATSINGAEYFIEGKEWTHSEVHELIGVPTFNEGNIRQILREYREGFKPHKMEDSTRRYLEDRRATMQMKRELEMVIYNGKIEGKYLIENNVMVEDPQKFYEAEVWVIGAYCIRAVLNPNPMGHRPIFATSFVKVNNSIWGQSVIDVVYDVQRVCNAAARATVKNMGYSSGPIGEVVGDRLADNDDETDVKPYKIFRVGPDITGTGAPAFKFHNVASVAPDLMNVFDRFNKMADDLSGVPAYVLGNPDVAGAGRTLGGLSMLMGNAAKGIKNVQLNIDRDVIAPIVSAMYYYNMVVSPDMGIKADAKIVARGATGLLQRELAQSNTISILQLLTPYVQMQAIDKTALDYILRAVLQNTGLPVDKIIPDPDQASTVQDLTSLLGGQAVGSQAQSMQRGTSNPVALPPQSTPPPNPQMQPIPQPPQVAGAGA
ncbi:MAG TPA: hypothetical protein VN679_15385 [Candidatus Acidoferrales bacterium]|nr:hypothetical protein [Candidatus Acidoferrales bacterium]